MSLPHSTLSLTAYCNLMLATPKHVYRCCLSASTPSFNWQLATGNAVTLRACYHIFTTVSTDRPPHTYVYDKAQNLKTLCMWFEARPRGVGITTQVSGFAFAFLGSVGFLVTATTELVFGWCTGGWAHSISMLFSCLYFRSGFYFEGCQPSCRGWAPFTHPLCTRRVLFSFGMIRFLTFSIWLLCIWVLFPPSSTMRNNEINVSLNAYVFGTK